jgi:hypothetical protein
MISGCKPCTYLVSRLLLFPNGPKWASTWASAPSSTISASKTIFESMVLLAQPCTYLALTLTLSPNGSKRASTWASWPRSTIGCIQNNLWAYGTFGATMHLSCTNTNTICKQTEMSFYLRFINKEYHRVRPKWFLSLGYVRCKPCTYLASRLPLSPNGPK